MLVIESCAKCLYERQCHKNKDEQYLKEVKRIIDNRGEMDCAPYLVYLFNKEYEKRFGKPNSYADIKKQYNDLVLSMEDALRERIQATPDSLKTAFSYSRIGNYIDFGATNTVNQDEFLALFDNVSLSEADQITYKSFLEQCKDAKTFLLVADNCGEIVLDKLFIEELKKCFPNLDITVMVRGGEVLNDNTYEDAIYCGVDKVAKIITNGVDLAGTVYEMLPDDIKEIVDSSDVIFAKGQGNYESMSRQGRHVFYSFLCKCDLFTERFKVPRLTGMFVEENK